MTEKNYDFLKRHWMVHQKGRRNIRRKTDEGELLLDSSWKIGTSAGVVAENAVRDFQDYLWVSMEISVGRARERAEKTIWLEIDASVQSGFALEAQENSVCIRLSQETEAFRAVVYLEDMMNLEGAPVVLLGETMRSPMYEMRSVHSGCGIDEYPDEELCAVVHGGYDTIIVFVKGIDEMAGGHCKINDIIYRASQYGLKVMLYNYIPAFVHPDDPNAEEMFDRAYGELFRQYPDAAGIAFYGESLEFPSKDPHTTGKPYLESMVDGIADTRPSPGWYPCEDYPAYLSGIERAVHRVKPEAKIVFSTYNWAYESQKLREAFLERIPQGLTVSVCYEIQSKKTLEGLRTPVMDYTISADAPGEYFVSECEVCKRLNIPIEGNVNTAGVAWDFGCVPYVPAPYKVLKRMVSLRKAKKEWGVNSHYATHHFGWWNDVAADLGKWSSWENFEPDYQILIEKIAVRDYGARAAFYVLEAWKQWSEAMNYYVASNEDQYGPWRVCAAYPFIFQPNITRTMQSKEIQFPTAPHAHFGYKIIKTLYQPYENVNQAPGFLRYPAEIRSLKKMEECWQKGLDAIKLAVEVEAENVRSEKENTLGTENLRRLEALGQFLFSAIRTVIHVKQWWMLNMKLQNSSDQEEALRRLDEIERIARAEMENVKSAIPAAEVDSRLGWEPSMEYVCDRWHLEWKLRQMESALGEIETYRSIVKNAHVEC